MIVLLAAFLSLCSPSSLEIPILPPSSVSASEEKEPTIFQKISEKAIYFGAGGVLGTASILAKLGWGICLVSPWVSTIGNECLFASHVLDSCAQYAFACAFQGSPSPSPFFKNVPLSHRSWYLNQALLSHVPASSEEENRLLLFLEKRWLAKSSGFYATFIDWVCPCFGVYVQVHPETTGFYARDPGLGFPPAYENRMKAWKELLPHPEDFPLVLTRPLDLRDYLPLHIEVPRDESIEKTLQRLSEKKQPADEPVVIDLTAILSTNDREQWLQDWNAYQAQLSKSCKERNIDPHHILCIQRIQQEEIGGIRLLPFTDQSAEEIEEHHRHLLEWISIFGLTANRIELDRWPIISHIQRDVPSISMNISKEEFGSFLDTIENTWKSSHPQKTLMLKGTLQLLRGLLAAISEEKWQEISNSPTRSGLAQVSFEKIREQLNLLAKKDEKASFFATASHIEQIHADLSTLLEVFSPFNPKDFAPIYRNLLTIPQKLMPFASYGLHMSGMTNLAAIFKAVEKSIGKLPTVLYGENAYFENIYAAEMVSHAVSFGEATETDWKEVDLILAQFNPALRRVDFKITEYHVERVSELLHKSLNVRQGKPLTIAIDCTFDFIDSPRVSELLEEFEEEIESGILNVISYRSGLKFDLFGMDNYCGAPFSMIHSPDAKWASFDALLTEPILQTDRLSINWFCLAYQNAVPELESYRKQVFDNTRALLDKVPRRLLRNDVNYRIIPMEQGADLAFIDFKIFGPCHQLRASLLIGGGLILDCMAKNHPIFIRASVGFYHPNFTIIYGEECSTIRLTLGLDPAEVDILADCFARIDELNGSSWQTSKLRQNIPVPLFIGF